VILIILEASSIARKTEGKYSTRMSVVTAHGRIIAT
jgi:hypothetical protein